MPLQPAYGDLRAPGERRSTTPTPVRIITASDTGQGPIPETVDAPRIGMTRHAAATARWPAHVEAGGILPGNSWAVTLIRAECGKTPFHPSPPRSVWMLASFAAEGYKMSLSGGFLFRAAGSAGVQNVTFAGVFVPQVWNRQGRRSASRIHPVGARLRLYHAVPDVHTASHPTCKHLYTSRTSPKTAKFPCTERRGAHCPPYRALPFAHLAATLNEIQAGDPGEMGSSMNPHTGAYPGPSGAITLA